MQFYSLQILTDSLKNSPSNLSESLLKAKFVIKFNILINGVKCRTTDNNQNKGCICKKNLHGRIR